MDPLQSSLILQTVLKGLSFKTLLKCRLINKLWNYEANKLLKGRCATPFIKRKALSGYLETCENRNDHSIQLNSFLFASTFLETSLEEDKDEALDLNKAEVNLNQFISISSEHLTELDLLLDYPNVTFKDEVKTVGQEMLFNLIYSFPNLTTLKLFIRIPPIYLFLTPEHLRLLGEVVSKRGLLPNLNEFVLEIKISDYRSEYDYQRCEGLFNQFTRNILQSAPNLKSINCELKWSRYCRAIEVNPIMENISLVSSELKSLAFEFQTFRDSDLEQLISRSFPKLEEFRIIIDDVSEDSLKRFLIQYSGTLKLLGIGFNMNHTISPFPADGVVMEKLETLIVGYRGQINWNCLPNLKRLEVVGDCIDWQPHFPQPESKWSLRSLRIRPQDFSEQVELPNWFCYLQELEITKVEPAQLRQIFGSCRLLKKLCIWETTRMGDETICGIARTKLLETSPFANFPKNPTEKEVTDLISFAAGIKRDFPFLGDLKDLEELTLKGRRFRITDISILFGVVHCKKLRRLRISGVESKHRTWRSDRIIKFGLKDLVKCKINLSPLM